MSSPLSRPGQEQSYAGLLESGPVAVRKEVHELNQVMAARAQLLTPVNTRRDPNARNWKYIRCDAQVEHGWLGRSEGGAQGGSGIGVAGTDQDRNGSTLQPANRHLRIEAGRLFRRRHTAHIIGTRVHSEPQVTGGTEAGRSTVEQDQSSPAIRIRDLLVFRADVVAPSTGCCTNA